MDMNMPDTVPTKTTNTPLGGPKDTSNYVNATVKELQKAADIATLNASQNTGAGPDARYDQAQAAKAQAALAARLQQDAIAKAAADKEAAQLAAIESARIEAEKEAARLAALEAARNNRSPLVTSLINNQYVAPAPTPPTPTNTYVPTVIIPTPPVKTAPIDTILFNDDLVPIEVMSDLIFENIGGQELINISRSDIINGQQLSYQPIKNLYSIQQQYNPNNIVSLQSTSDKYFANFSIKLEDKTPINGNGPYGTHVYLDDTTGNIVVEAVNLNNDEQIEVEITTSGTIYEAEI